MPRATNWIDVEHGRQAPRMSEQVYLQSNGFALIMLWYEPADDPDYDEDGEGAHEASAITVHIVNQHIRVGA